MGNFEILGELYYQFALLQRQLKTYEEALKLKDNQISILQQKLQALKEFKASQEDLAQKVSDK